MYKVGLIEGTFIDDKRRAWSGFGGRPLRCSVWYPASREAVEEMYYLGPPGQALFHMGQVAVGVPVVERADPFPVVLLSHGTGGTAKGLGWLGCRLAQRGYVAIGVDHHGNTATEPYLAEGFFCCWERARDLSAVFDQVSEEPLFQGRLDQTRVFAAGFSLGGYTVLALAGAITDLAAYAVWQAEQGRFKGPREFPDLGERVGPLLGTSTEFRASRERHRRSYRDARVKAVYACAPAPPVRAFTAESLAAIEIPGGVIVGPADTEVPYQECACWLAERIPGCRLTLLSASVGHYVFLCEATAYGQATAPDICLDAPGIDRRTIHNQTTEEMLALFQCTD